MGPPPLALDQLVARAATWLEPIPGAAPAGAPATYEPDYQAVRAEIEKLETPTGGAVEWNELSRKAGDLLRTRTKDLLLASVLARALHVTAGPAGLATGAALLAGMLDRYWEAMEPGVKRLRARANSLTWFIEKSVLALAGDLPALPAAEVEELLGAVATLAEVARARLGDATPAFGPLLACLERLRLAAIPAPAAPVDGPGASDRPGPDPATGAVAPVVTAPTALAPTVATTAPAGPTAATVLALPEPPPALGSRQDVTDFLARVGLALVEAARALRQAATDDATAYRVLRAGLWLHLDAPPPSEGGRTAIAPPPEPLRKKLALLAQNEQWLVLLDEAESALPRQRLALDLQRASWQALGGLGPTHQRARDAVAEGLRELLARMPQLPALSFADGSPLASAGTQTWIDEVVSPRAAGPTASVPTDGADRPARLARVKELLQGGDAVMALAKAQEVVLGGASGRERFLTRLELARACAGAGLAALAKALYEELSREAKENGLDAWEPRLSAEALKGLIAAARSLVDDPRGAPQQLAEHYRRLCVIDPAAAHHVWP